MKKLFIDTNVWLRFFLKDEAEQYETVYRLISQIESGRFRAYTSSIVFLEINYVLKSVYKFSFKEIDEVFRAIKEVRGITIIDEANFDKTLIYWRKYQIKFSDCLIAGQTQKGMVLVTFDEELTKIKEVIVKRPADVVG